MIKYSQHMEILLSLDNENAVSSVDQVIGIHSVSELETQLNAVSTTCRLAILYFYKARPCRFILES
jgi:hypothetical protein